MYDKDEGKLPRMILEVFPQQVASWISHFTKNEPEKTQLFNSLEIDAKHAPSLEEFALTIESFIFPPVFSNPLYIKIVPPIYSAGTHMENSQKLLNRCLTDILTNSAWRDPEFNYDISGEQSGAGGSGFAAAWTSVTPGKEAGGRTLVRS